MSSLLAVLRPRKERPPTTSSFLSLPGELRNLIYEQYMLLHQPRTIGIRHGQVLGPPLARISRQVRQEFDSLCKGSGFQMNLSRVIKIRAKVRNLDFAGLVRFLMTDVSGQSLAFQLKRIKVLLDFTETCDVRRMAESIRAWIELYDGLREFGRQPCTTYRSRYDAVRTVLDRELLRTLLGGKWWTTQRDLLEEIEVGLDRLDRRAGREGGFRGKLHIFMKELREKIGFECCS